MTNQELAAVLRVVAKAQNEDNYDQPSKTRQRLFNAGFEQGARRVALALGISADELDALYLERPGD